MTDRGINMYKMLVTIILVSNSFLLVAQEIKPSDINEAKQRVGDYLFTKRRNLEELKLNRQKEQHNNTHIDWQGVGQYLEQASGQESQENSQLVPKKELNVYLTRTEERIGARLCHYSNGSVVRVEAGWPCPM